MRVLNSTIFVQIILFYLKLLKITFASGILYYVYEEGGVLSSHQYNIICIMLQLTKKEGTNYARQEKEQCFRIAFHL